MTQIQGNTPRPVALKMAPDQRVSISWNDGQTRLYAARELRDRCPCATCREKRSAPEAPANPLQVLSVAEVAPVRVTGMRPVGQYAYAISFSDGHDTGIYTFDLLREIGEASAE